MNVVSPAYTLANPLNLKNEHNLTLRLSDRLALQVLSQPSMWSICRAAIKSYQIMGNILGNLTALSTGASHQSQLHEGLTNAIL